jgi:uroporphyrinogen decarboxylase
MAITPRRRLEGMLAGQAPDRWPFVPSVYEHGAALLGRSPGETSRDAALMAEAALTAYERYGHDLLTVGIDIYNIEAEALGCAISAGDEHSIPGVVSHPLAAAAAADTAALPVPEPGPSNRLGLIAEAVERVVKAVGEEIWVYGCMGGPFSQAVELRGFTELITDMYTCPERVHRLLARTTALSVDHATRLSQRGAGVYLYESWATLPLIDPTIFGTYVVPYNRTVIQAVRRAFDTPPPGVVMGGDTALLMDFFLQAGTSIVVADFNTDFEFMKERTEGRTMLIRGCVDPKQIERGDWDALEQAVGTLARKAHGMSNFLWGCGCVSYDTPPEHLLRFKELCRQAAS